MVINASMKTVAYGLFCTNNRLRLASEKLSFLINVRTEKVLSLKH